MLHVCIVVMSVHVHACTCRWYCHFDDDMYVNIKELVPALREGLRRSKDGGVYVGRFPNDTIRSNLNGIRVREVDNAFAVIVIFNFGTCT